MSDIEGERAAIAEDLTAARSELLDAVRGASPAAFAGGPGRALSARDIAWEAGLREDWARRAVALGVEGRGVEPYQPRPRPAIAQTRAYLEEWLEQCRRPTLALLRRLEDDDLDREFTLPEGEPATARGLLLDIARRDRQHAAQMRVQLGEPRRHDGQEAS